MSDLSITINGRNHVIACEDGQEEHLARLAEYIDKLGFGTIAIAFCFFMDDMDRFLFK